MRSVRRSSGERLQVAAAVAAHTVGDLVVEGGWVGLCEQTCAIGQPTTLIIFGNIGLVGVPGATAQGSLLYAVGAPPVAGTRLATLTTTALTLTAAGNTLVAKALSAAVNGQAEIRLLPGSF